MRRSLPVSFAVLTLVFSSCFLWSCAASHATTQAAQTTPDSQKCFVSLGQLDEPGYLFTRDDGANCLVVNAMAYNGACKARRPPRGAWGDPLTSDVKAVAISPDLLKMGLDHGDTIQIEGLPGEYKVLDLMHPRHKKAIDIYYGNDRCGARQWGKRVLTITWK